MSEAAKLIEMGDSSLMYGFCGECVDKLLESLNEAGKNPKAPPEGGAPKRVRKPKEEAPEPTEVVGTNAPTRKPSANFDKSKVYAEPKVTTGNTATGAAFTLPQGVTCPGETPACKGCYGDYGNMRYDNVKDAKFKNLGAVINDLKQDPSGQKLGLSLTKAVKQKNTGTLRIHDLGDFFSPSYVKAWVQAVKNCPETRFWAYTRAHTVAPIMQELVKLASLPNMELWLSADKHNWTDAVQTFDQYKDVLAGVAMMQTKGTGHIAKMIQDMVGKKHFINFPEHGNGGYIKNPTEVDSSLVNCPKVIDHDTKARTRKAVEAGKMDPPAKILKNPYNQPDCLACGKCLPGKNQKPDEPWKFESVEYCQCSDAVRLMNGQLDEADFDTQDMDLLQKRVDGMKARTDYHKSDSEFTMDHLTQRSGQYRVGWNSIVDGIADHREWAQYGNHLDWANHVQQESTREEAAAERAGDYMRADFHRGRIDGADEVLSTGKIAKLR